MLHQEYLVRTETLIESEGWEAIEPTPEPQTQLEVDPSPAIPRSSQLIREGYMRAGSRVVPLLQPDQYEQVGSVTVIRHGKYDTPKAAALAAEAGRYHQELAERYGPDNVETCLDEAVTARTNESPAQQVTYYVRLGTHSPEKSPKVEQATDQ